MDESHKYNVESRKHVAEEYIQNKKKKKEYIQNNTIFLKVQRQENKHNTLYRNSHIYSKIILKTREITTTTTKSGSLVGKLGDGLGKAYTRRCSAIGIYNS